ncbi:DUF2089 domain-containing protein [Bdellovibrio sp. HCB337]|uniref:DUF2089 domain-containing protein n=1 Tax=Bdellovibrio sp. HCB337 TaxID=3394358 RepID=UPI0039A41BD6
MSKVKDWKELTNLTQNKSLIVERVRLTESDIAIEGSFELPALAKLTLEDQVFIMAFVSTHGSIKEMEKIFGVSYPTIKGRLNKISEQLQLVDINPAPSKSDILERLNRGEITAQEAAEMLRNV